MCAFAPQEAQTEKTNAVESHPITVVTESAVPVPVYVYVYHLLLTAVKPKIIETGVGLAKMQQGAFLAKMDRKMPRVAPLSSITDSAVCAYKVADLVQHVCCSAVKSPVFDFTSAAHADIACCMYMYSMRCGRGTVDCYVVPTYIVCTVVQLCLPTPMMQLSDLQMFCARALMCSVPCIRLGLWLPRHEDAATGATVVCKTCG